MTGFDIIVLLIVGLAAVGGFMRGFVHEVISLLAWMLAVIAIRYLHTDLTQLLHGFIGTPSGSSVLAFAILLLIPYAVMKVIAGRVGKASRRSMLGPFDRVLGFGFGAVKGVIIVVMAFSLLELGYDIIWGNAERPPWIITARTYRFVNASSEAMVQLISERQKRLREQDAKLDSAAE
ncbi:MAG: CvpA family protein [Croceibacterium sp.]